MTELLYSPKIKPEHLARKTIVYLRQSSERQVRQNLESQRLQYAMGERMHALGWKDVEIVSHDLSASAAMASARREGFERLLGAVALGEVGIVVSREVSRVAYFPSGAPTLDSSHQPEVRFAAPRPADRPARGSLGVGNRRAASSIDRLLARRLWPILDAPEPRYRDVASALWRTLTLAHSARCSRSCRPVRSISARRNGMPCGDR